MLKTEEFNIKLVFCEEITILHNEIEKLGYNVRVGTSSYILYYKRRLHTNKVAQKEILLKDDQNIQDKAHTVWVQASEPKL